MADQDKLITDDEMADLPNDDRLAFVAYEERLRSRTRGRSTPEEGSSLEREYVNHILAFIKVAGLDIPVEKNPPYDDRQFWPWYHRFLDVIDYHTVEIRLTHARGMQEYVVTALYLSQDYRTEIRKLLDRVAKVVNQADIPDNKKDRIYDRISDLQREVDRSRTRLDAFLSRWLDVAAALGEGAENLEPAVKLLERVMKVFGSAKADHDSGKLPPPEETQKLPAPEPEGLAGSDEDDEIPF